MIHSDLPRFHRAASLGTSTDPRARADGKRERGDQPDAAAAAFPACHDGGMPEPETDRQPFAVPGALVLAGMVSLGIIAVVVALAASIRVLGPAGA